MHNALNILARALGVLVGQSSGGQLAMALEATLRDIISSPFFFWHKPSKNMSIQLKKIRKKNKSLKDDKRNKSSFHSHMVLYYGA